MSAETIGLEAFIKLDQFVSGAAQYNRLLDQMNSQTSSIAGGISTQFTNLGNKVLSVVGSLGTMLAKALAAAGAAMAGFAVSGIKQAATLEQKLADIRAVLGGTAEEMAELKDLTLDLALDPRLKVSASEAAGAIENLATAGLTVDEILNGAAEATVLLANATGADFGEAATIATDAMAVFGIKAEDMVAAVSHISAVGAASKFTIEDYAYAIAQGGGAASAAGVEFEDFNTTIAAIAPMFKSGSDAGTSFKTFITRLAPQTDKATEAMAELGLWTAETGSAFYDAEGNLKSMSDISVLLNDALAGLSEQQRITALNTIFGADAMRAAEGIARAGEPAFTSVKEAMEATGLSFKEAAALVESGVTEFEYLNQVMGETDAAELAAIRMDTLVGAMDILRGIVEAVQLKIGDVFLPTVRQLVEGFSEFVTTIEGPVVEFFQSVSDSITGVSATTKGSKGPVEKFFNVLQAAGVPPEFIDQLDTVIDTISDVSTAVSEFVTEHADALEGAIKGIGVALAGAGIVAALVAIGGAITFLLSPVGLLIAGAAALGAAIETNFAGIGDAVRNIATAVQDGSFTWETAWTQITTVAGNIWTMLEPHLTALGQQIKTWFLSIDFAGIGLSLWNGLLAQFNTLWTQVSTWFAGQDWAGLALSGAMLLVEGFGQLGALIGQTAGDFYIALTEWIAAVDWFSLGSTFMTWLGTAIVGALGLLATAITGIYTYFSELFASQDWLSIGVNLVTAVVNGMTAFRDGAIATLAGWAQTLWDWVAGVDWAQIGIDIVSFVINGLSNFAATAITTLGEWAQTFADWVAGVDWHQVGYDIVKFVIEGLDFFKEDIPTALSEWFQSFTDWSAETDWNAVTDELIANIMLGLADFVFSVQPTLTSWYEAFKTWFFSVNWAKLATAIIDGLVSGLMNGASALGEAIGGLIDGMFDAANDEAETHSPSRRARKEIGEPISEGIGIGVRDGAGAVDDAIRDTVTRPIEGIGDAVPSMATRIGENLAQALVDGITGGAATVGDALSSLLDMAGSLGGIGSGFVRLFEERELNPLQDQIKGLEGGIKDILKKDLKDAMKRFNVDTLDDLVRVAGFAPGAFSGKELMALQEAVALEEERAAASAEYAKQQEYALELQKQQQDLAFLKQQLDLLNLIRDAGLDPADILGGLEFGLDASLPDLISAMSSAMQAIIGQAEDDLGIASPSKVFEQIGRFINRGLASGLGMVAPLQAAMNRVDEALTASVMNVPQVVNRAFQQFGRVSPTANVTAPSTVSLDPGSLRALQGNTVSNSRTYQLSVATRETQSSVRDNFRLMEMVG